MKERAVPLNLRGKQHPKLRYVNDDSGLQKYIIPRPPGKACWRMLGEVGVPEV